MASTSSPPQSSQPLPVAILPAAPTSPPRSLSASASPSTPGPPTPPEQLLDDLPASSSPEQQQQQQQQSPTINGQQPDLVSPLKQDDASSTLGGITIPNGIHDHPPLAAGSSPTRNHPTQNSSSPSASSSSASPPPQVNGAAVNGVVLQQNGDPAGTAAATVGGGAAVDSSHSDADGEVFSDEWLADMRRVKVYELVGQRWTDRGTALCTGVYDEELDQAAIVARSETSDAELLRSEIRMNDVYQRQQETLIVWTEPDGTDYALSFQDVEGCAEIWDFIIEVQRHFRGKLGDIGASSSSPTRADYRGISANQIISDGRLPEPTLGIIGEIDKAIKFIGRTPAGKEKICEYIVQEDYLKGLIDVMSQAEDLEALSDLHALCNLVQTILMMNDHSIYDYILQDDIYTGVIGMLEYDPDFPTYKASYREYLANSTHYKEVVAFRDTTIRKKIHQTYRLQYLKDVVLARVLDDPTFNVLNSFILFNQIDIINYLQNDEALLKDMFGRFESPESTECKGKEKEKEVDPEAAVLASASTSTAVIPSFLADLCPADIAKRDIVILLHQLCMMGKNVQIPARLALYRALVDKGLLHCLQWALSRPAEDQQMLNAAGEILLIVCDHDVGGVRSFVLKQADPTGEWDKPTAKQVPPMLPGAGFDGPFGSGGGGGLGGMEGGGGGTGTLVYSASMGMMTPMMPTVERKSTVTTVLTVIVKVLTTSKDLALRGQMAESLKTLLELPIADENPALKSVARPREDPVTERFLQYFYDSCIGTLYRPLMDVPEFKDVTGPTIHLTRDQSSLLLYLCDNLCNSVVQHSHRSQFYILSTSIARRVATLLKAREKHLRLAAMRFFRMCLKMNNNFFVRHLLKNEVFLPVLELALREARRDNLLNSSCQEFFEHVRKENVRLVIAHIMEKYEPLVKSLCVYGSMAERFKGIVLRWEQNNEPRPQQDTTNGTVRLGRPGQNLMSRDDDDDEYFLKSDEDEIGPMPASTPVETTGQKRKREARAHRVARAANGSPTLRSKIPVLASGAPPGIVLPSPYPMKTTTKLVDYEDAEDDGSGGSSPRDRTPPEDDSAAAGTSGIPTSGLARTRSSSSLMLANGHSKKLAGANGSSSPSGSQSPPPMPPHKRRRDDDDEDDTLSLLGGATGNATNKAKRAGSAKEEDKSSSSSASGSRIPTPGVDRSASLRNVAGGVAKKIKLSLGKAGFGIASTSSSSSSTNTNTASKKEPESGAGG